MSRFINKFHNLKNDRILLSTVYLSYAFVALHVIGYFDSNGLLEVKVRIAFLLVYPLIAFLFGRKGSAVWLIIYSYILFWFKGTIYYTAFMIIALLCVNQNLKTLLWVFIPYAILVAIRTQIYDVPPFRVVFHLLKCSVLFMVIRLTCRKKEVEKTLILTPDEEDILMLLAQGYRVSEINLFSQNTVYEKLKNARERNNVSSNKELIIAYKNSDDYKKKSAVTTYGE